jgi:hypothetical protein
MWKYHPMDLWTTELGTGITCLSVSKYRGWFDVNVHVLILDLNFDMKLSQQVLEQVNIMGSFMFKIYKLWRFDMTGLGDKELDTDESRHVRWFQLFRCSNAVEHWARL